jgi:hypothetical protein
MTTVATWSGIIAVFGAATIDGRALDVQLDPTVHVLGLPVPLHARPLGASEPGHVDMEIVGTLDRVTFSNDTWDRAHSLYGYGMVDLTHLIELRPDLRPPNVLRPEGDYPYWPVGIDILGATFREEGGLMIAGGRWTLASLAIEDEKSAWNGVGIRLEKITYE